jgi:hypothetical protein
MIVGAVLALGVIAVGISAVIVEKTPQPGVSRRVSV